MKKTLYLMRHGQTLFNARKKIQGWCDAPLTELGIKQAKIAGKYFKDNNIVFDHAYSSTSERACDTLELVCDLPYHRVKGLKEWNFGIYEGESEDLNPPVDKYDDFFPIYGGETRLQVMERMLETLQNIMEQDACQTVLAVSHAGACRCFLSHLGQPEQLLNGQKLGNCSILHFHYDQGQFTFVEMLNI